MNVKYKIHYSLYKYENRYYSLKFLFILDVPYPVVLWTQAPKPYEEEIITVMDMSAESRLSTLYLSQLLNLYRSNMPNIHLNQ